MSERDKITKIEVEEGDVTFYFNGTDQPCGVPEFKDSKTKDLLSEIEILILDYNEEP